MDNNNENNNFSGSNEPVYPSAAPEKPAEQENRAKILNDYLFEYAANGNGGKPLNESKEKKSRGILKRAVALLLVLATAFLGAFYGMYFVCNTSIVGDSDFFAAFMARWAGVTENRVEVDYITGEYTGNNIELADKILQSTVLVRTVVKDEESNTLEVLSQGSGVIYSYNESSGHTYVVTNYHVIENENDILIETYAGDRHYASVKATDQLSDIALLEFTSDKPLTPASHADSDKLKAGQSAAIAGNPLGHGFSVSFGYIASPKCDTGDASGSQIQLDVSVNPGNSGGGAFDSEGNLIGIIVSKASGENVDGIGYAIPVNKVNEVISDLLVYGYVQGRPALNITVVSIITEAQFNYYMSNDLNGKLFKGSDGSMNYGVYVAETRNSVLRVGDRLVSINGISITGNESVSNAISKLSPGTAVKIVVERANVDADGNVTFTKTTENVVLGTRDWAD